MDLSVAASMFDDQPIYDKYTGALLFMGQPLTYDGSVRDSVASWRQSVSAETVVTPDRGVVMLGRDTFIAGRIIQDFFQGDVIRENVILHPCDDSYQKGHAVNFLTDPIPAEVVPFYGGVTWRKSSSDEKESPELHNICDVYFSGTETYPDPDDLILAGNDIMYRVRSIESREGGFMVAVCSELGVGAVVDATYSSKGAYDAATDSVLGGAPVSLKAIIELAKTNFKFVVAATAKYEPGDRVVTLREIDVTSPKPEDAIVVGGVDYFVVSAHLDEAGSCWELHCRRD